MKNLETLVEVTLAQSDDFLKVKETLTRIGVAAKGEKKLYQSCHILHKQGKYYIVHFKELFELDGRASDFSESDKARRNTIANLLCDWGLLKLVDKQKSSAPVTAPSQIKILPHNQKAEWDLISKYTIGKRA